MIRRILGVAIAFGALIAACRAQTEPVVLNYAVQDTDASIGVVRQTVAEFEAAHPNIRVKIQQVTDEYFMRLLTQYAAGVAPDVAEMNVSMYQPFAMRGALLPLEGFVQRSKDIDLRQWYPNIVRFFSWDGHLWGLPKDVSPFGLIFYNKTLFDRAGIKHPDGTWTWSYEPRDNLREHDFTWVVDHLTAKDQAGKTTQFGFAPDWPQLYFYLLLQSRGLKLWDNDEAPRKIIADDPRVVRLMEFASDEINTKNWIPTWDQIDTVDRSTVYDEFVKGKVAMILTFAAKIGQLRKDMARMGWDWDVTIFPAYEGRPLSLATDGSAPVIFSSTKHPKEAWEFVKWVAGKPGQILDALSGTQPARRDLATEPGLYLPGPNSPPEMRKPAHLAITDKAAMAMEFDQTPEYFEDTRNYLDTTAFDILSGTRPPKETLDRVTHDSQIRLDAALRKLPKDLFPMDRALALAAIVVLAAIAWLVWPERKIRYSMAQRKESRSAYKFLIPLSLGLCIFTFGPILYSLILSFSNSDIIRPPLWRGFGNYTDAVTVDPVFWTSVRVTVTYALITIPLSLVVSVGLALLLNQKVRGVPLFRAMYYLPSLVSGVATSLIWMRVFNPQNGILNAVIYGPDGRRNILGVSHFLSNWAGTPGQPVNWLGNEHTVLPAFALVGMWGAGAGTIIFLAGLQGIPSVYYDAAKIDGASAFGRFRHVMFPLLTPTIFFSLITGCIGALLSFTQSFVMTEGGPNNATMFYMLNLYLEGFKSLKMGYACALAWMLFVGVLIVTAIQLGLSKRWVYYEGELK